MSQYIVSAILFVLFLYGAVFNALALWNLIIKKREWPSGVSFGSGILGAVSLLVWPEFRLARYAWIPLVADVGCVPYLCIAIPCVGRQLYMTSRLFRLATFVSIGIHDSSVTLVLYKTGRFVLKKETTKPTWSLLSIGGSDWSREGEGLSLQVSGIDVRYALQDEEGIPVLKWCPDNEPSILDHTDLRLTHGQLN
jgi:hypothetical protein